MTQIQFSSTNNFGANQPIIEAKKEGFFKTLKIQYFKLIMKLSLLYFFKFAKGEVNGIENIRRFDEYIIAMNHVSYLDWMVIFSYYHYYQKKHVTFLAKEKLFSNLFFGPLMQCANCVCIPDNFDFKNYKELIIKLRNAKSIIGIFPEGTRSYDGKIQPPKTGIINIAQLLGLPIVPVGLKGFYEAWPRNKMLPKLKNIKMKINFGKPMIMPYKIYVHDKKQGINTIMANIQKLVAHE